MPKLQMPFGNLQLFGEICGMFTGIVETTGTVNEVVPKGSNLTFWITSPLSAEFKVDQSVSHNGVCLTVEEVRDNMHRVTAIDETLKKTSLQNWRSDTTVNMERCLPLNGRLDGHFVQGHVDTTGICVSKIAKQGSWEMEIEFPPSFAALVIEKGSICVDGISLTAFAVTKNTFTVAIIPYTYSHTNISRLAVGDAVNLEFDLVGKYIMRKLSIESESQMPAV